MGILTCQDPPLPFRTTHEPNVVFLTPCWKSDLTFSGSAGYGGPNVLALSAKGLAAQNSGSPPPGATLQGTAVLGFAASFRVSASGVCRALERPPVLRIRQGQETRSKNPAARSRNGFDCTKRHQIMTAMPESGRECDLNAILASACDVAKARVFCAVSHVKEMH